MTDCSRIPSEYIEAAIEEEEPDRWKLQKPHARLKTQPPPVVDPVISVRGFKNFVHTNMGRPGDTAKLHAQVHLLLRRWLEDFIKGLYWYAGRHTRSMFKLNSVVTVDGGTVMNFMTELGTDIAHDKLLKTLPRPMAPDEENVSSNEDYDAYT